MSDKSKIEWTDSTWNPIRGTNGKWHCTKVSPGCTNCYAERMNVRFGGPQYRVGADTLRLDAKQLTQPLRWKRPRRIFVCSMTDLFHGGVRNEWIAAVFGVMAASPQHTYQVLTKRPERALDWFRYIQHGVMERGPDGYGGRGIGTTRITPYGFEDNGGDELKSWSWPLPNVWIGASVENQEYSDKRIPQLLQIPASVRFLSCEPLLGPVNFRWQHYHHEATGESYREYMERNGLVGHLESLKGIHWVIVGGESGPHARPMHPEWARSLRDQCHAAGVAFHFKQWGGWIETDAVPGGDLGGDMRRGLVDIIHPDGGESTGYFRPGDVIMRRVGKKTAGRVLDDRTWDELPVEGRIEA